MTKNLVALLTRCREHNLKLNKCRLMQSQMRYMGYELVSQDLHLDPDRVDDIMTVPAPQDRKEVQVFLGMFTFVSRFIPNTCVTTAPLRQLLKDATWLWTDAQEESFRALRASIAKAPLLAFFNQTKPVKLLVDASHYDVGAVILQGEHSIAYSSRSLAEVQQRYAPIEKETLAIVHDCVKLGE